MNKQRASYHIDNIDHLDLALLPKDRKIILEMHRMYQETTALFPKYNASSKQEQLVYSQEMIKQYALMGKKMQAFFRDEKKTTIYPFSTPQIEHGAASRIIAKLRDINTQNAEFVYYTQRAYEILFQLLFSYPARDQRNHFYIKTPVTHPTQSVAVHKLPDIDDNLQHTVMCVMLRGSLLPSMIISKEIEEYSSTGYVTPFMLFDIKRKEHADGIRYMLDLEHSYFNMDVLSDKILIFADPMNATAGSFITVVQYLLNNGVRPKKIIFLNIISSIKGALRVIRNIENINQYVLWMDPSLNDRGYIVPGLGDAGDRLNGKDPPRLKRNVVELIADYGSAIANLYRSQIRAIETTVLR